jgi:hypothetical protein
MPFWSRRKPIHEELAEGTGLLDWEEQQRERGVPAFSGTLDVLHGGRQRRWDTVATAEAPALSGDELEFVTLPDGTVLVDVELPAGAVAPLAEAIEQELDPPYRAGAVRRDETVWAVAANSIDVVEVPEEVGGDTVSLVVKGDEHTQLVDELPSLAQVPTLESFARERHRDFVLQAERLDGELWSAKVNAL